ncbi:unnamed protein product [Camellia sinensis]
MGFVAQGGGGGDSNDQPNQPHSDVKLFNRWSFDDVQDYIAVSAAKHATYVPHTAGRYSIKRFRKAQCPIVERLTNSLMMHGRNNGKKLMAARIVKHAMEIIHLLTHLDPIQVIVDAVINSAWKTRASLRISPWNENVYLFQFDELEDRRRVLEDAPWSVMGSLLVLQPLQSGMVTSELEFRWCPFWVQVHGLPIEKLTKGHGETIGRRLGRLVRVEAHSEGLLLQRNFLRIRVEIDITKSLLLGMI